MFLVIGVTIVDLFAKKNKPKNLSETTREKIVFES
jgi:hypothetical protein